MKRLARPRVRALLLAFLLVLLPITALAATAILSDGLVGWRAIGGSSPYASSGGAYTLTGAAGQSGGHQVLVTGGGYSLNGGYVPLAPADDDAFNRFLLLPIIRNAVQ